MPVERTFVLLKPDAVARKLTGEILGRFERKGLKTIALKLLKITPELSKKHYAEHISKSWYPMLEEFITSGPVVALV
ncbi:MAG: nucleoside-diphosphate kinase, partial [Candidatus Saccharimonas sp.]|nr:nucleoside-diphosphate kinase [Planctomycetaceae bacterium]